MRWCGIISYVCARANTRKIIIVIDWTLIPGRSLGMCQYMHTSKGLFGCLHDNAVIMQYRSNNGCGLSS